MTKGTETVPSQANPRSARPLVAQAVSSRGVWVFSFGLIVAGIALFVALESRRSVPISPATMAPLATPGVQIAAPPPLMIPPLRPQAVNPPAFEARIISPGANAYPELIAPQAPRRPRAVPRPAEPGYSTPYYPEQPYPSQVPAAAARPELPAQQTGADPASLAGPRAGATRLANPATTVPQGAVIQAVLETALDSNRPGFARAIVSRDVRGFDGSRVLIPRGSRLIGEYKSDLVQGQNRAFIQWQTLTRPDGVQIAVNSPAADPLGRAGVKGIVNSHFFERFAGAILQSTLDIGVGIATRRVSDGTLIVGLPGSTQSVTAASPQSIKPTLKVPHGSSVSVFVARDLDFVTVE